MVAGLFAPALVATVATDARAQSTKPPNILILLDDSHSMAYAPPNQQTGNTPTDYPKCGNGNAEGKPNPSAEKSRWTLLTEALTGTINAYGCTPGDDNNPGVIYSNLCTAMPNANLAANFNWGSTPWAWPLDTVGVPAQRGPINFPHFKKAGNNIVPDGTNYCSFGTLGGSALTPKFDQSSDGIIDTFSKQIRFGMMSFDAGFPRFRDNVDRDLIFTGAVDLLGLGFWPGYGSTPANVPNANLFEKGQYSYWWNAAGNWTGNSGMHRGRYAKDDGTGGTMMDWEVGARNPYARPWEGRLMGFGSSDDPVEFSAQNDRVQLAVLALKPMDKGSSDDDDDDEKKKKRSRIPVSALMSDADDFILNDTMTLADYPTAGKSFLLGPKQDSACRQTHIILFTNGSGLSSNGKNQPTVSDNYKMYDPSEGTPYLDRMLWKDKLRPCYEPGGSCPYESAAYYADQLYTTLGVKTYVIATAVNKLRWKSNGQCPAKMSEQGSHCDADCNVVDASDFGPSGTPGKMCAGSVGNWDHANDSSGWGDIAACCELVQLGSKGQGGGKGGFFPSSVNDIKNTLASIISKILAVNTSRTVPDFAVAAPTIVIANNPQEPVGTPPASFEILSSLDTSAGMWSGHLERRRLSCDGTSESPTPHDVKPSLGDSYETNMIANAGLRKLFTVVARNPDGTVGVDGSIRRTDFTAGDSPVAASTDGLGSNDITLSYQTVPAVPDQLDNKIDAVIGGGLKTKDVLGIDYNSSETNCKNLLAVTGNGANTEAPCAEKALIWYGGGRNYLPNDRYPDAVNCPTCSPLGAIYHSNPVTVGPPSHFIRDEAYRNVYSIQHAHRPTVVYAQSLDGQLHAFVAASNADSADPDYKTTPKPVNASNNTELWSFIPPTVLPRIWPNFNANATLLDGGVVVSDTVTYRTAAQAESGVANWKTILVGSGGEAASGGFYYAMDVTNPLTPKFLWQLRTDGNDVPLFGKSVPTAAIATVAVQGSSPGTYNQVAVAILAGGTSSNGIPSGTTSRRCASCTGVACAPCESFARSTIRDWGDADSARSVTVVELQTGRIIKRFVGEINPAPLVGDPPALPGIRVAVGFDSPMTSTPVAFPNTPGSAASRAYVGDADGTLWRIDFSNPDPDKWSASIAYDLYETDYAGPGLPNKAIAGQPIELSPILSQDPLQNPVIMFATGAQEGFQTAAPKMRNYVASITDRLNGSGSAFVSQRDVVVEMKDGERATGPITLFNSSLYFASYVPNVANSCANGYPRIWGVNYLVDTSNPPVGTGLGDPANGLDTNSDGVADARFANLQQGAIVFGVGINRLPSCVTNASQFSDGWLAGSYKTDTVSAGKYQLVFQTGQTASAAPLGGEDLLSDPNQGAVTKSMHVNLPQPTNTLRVDSWSSVTE